MATRTISAAGGTRNWNDTASWDEGATPTASDDVVARGDGTSGNVTLNVTGSCRSIDLSNYSGTLTFTNGMLVGTSSQPGSLVALKFSTTMTVAGTGTIQFVSTVTGNTVTWNGKSAPNNVTFNGAAGGWVLQDTLNCGVLTLTAGTLDTNGKAVNSNSLTASGATTRALTLGATTWTTIGSAWNCGGSNITVSAASATIVLNRTAGGTLTFTGNGNTWGTLSITGTANVTFADANTFTTFSTTSQGGRTYTFTAGTTTTVTNLTMNGTSTGSLLTIVSSSAGSAATISVAAGAVVSSFLSLKDSTATGGATFRAEQSTNVSGNTGWTFGPLFSATIAGASTVTAAARLAASLTATIAGTSTCTADINWAKQGEGGFGA